MRSAPELPLFRCNCQCNSNGCRCFRFHRWGGTFCVILLDNYRVGTLRLPHRCEPASLRVCVSARLVGHFNCPAPPVASLLPIGFRYSDCRPSFPGPVLSVSGREGNWERQSKISLNNQVRFKVHEIMVARNKGNRWKCTMLITNLHVRFKLFSSNWFPRVLCSTE